MPTGELIEIYCAILSTLGILFVSLKYIISSRIAPIEAENKRLKEEQDKLEEEVDELKSTLLEEVKTISHDNFEFRIKYESGINEIRVLLAERYSSKKDLDKAVEELNRKMDLNIDLNQSIKLIMKSLRDLNS